MGCPFTEKLLCLACHPAAINAFPKNCFAHLGNTRSMSGASQWHAHSDNKHSMSDASCRLFSRNHG